MTTPELLRRLPKVQLHCHLEGTTPASTFVELARRSGVSTDYQETGFRDVAPADVYRFANMGEFLFKFAALSRSLRDTADYVRILEEYAQDAIAHNVMYAELFLSPSVWSFFHRDLDIRATIARLYDRAEAIEGHSGLRMRFICDLTRNFGSVRAMETAQLAAGLQEHGVIGIGLGGDEANFPAQLFVDAFAYARDAGLRCVAHAGEAAGAQSVRDALNHLHAERIGHGVRAIEDAQLVAELAARKVPLEVCPTSNLRTGVVARDGEQPLRKLYEAGVVVCVDSDDPAIFGTDITQEYLFAENQLGLEAALQIARSAIDASFASDGLKAGLYRRFDAACAELLAERRT